MNYGRMIVCSQCDDRRYFMTRPVEPDASEISRTMADAGWVDDGKGGFRCPKCQDKPDAFDLLQRFAKGG